MTPGPLWRRAPLRLLREGPWALLVVAAFAVTAAAAAADVLSVSAWRTASVDRVLDAVAEGAAPRASPIVRLAGTPGPGSALDALRRATDDAPGLTPTELLGVSFADELRGTRLVRYEGFAGAGGVRAPARMAAVDDPAAVLSVVAKADGEGSDGSDGPDGLWLPEALAAELGVGPGDSIEVGTAVSRRGEAATTTVVAGLYEATDGAVPVDLPGSDFWATRAGRLPGDAGGLGDPAVLVGDPATVVVLAQETEDVLLWTLDARLDPARPDRESLGDTVRAISSLRGDVAALPRPTEADELSTTLVSGLPGLAERSDDVTRRAAAEARTPALGAIGLGLALVLAVSTLTAARRRRELELLAGLGLRPPAVGMLALVEVLPAALLGLLVGGPLALLVVRRLAGVPPEPGAFGLAAGQAAAVVGAGVLVHALVTAVAAAAAARLGARHSRPDRSLPWRPVLVAAAVAAVAGLLAAPVGEARGLDLTVPVLVSAAVGALGATVLRAVASARTEVPPVRGGRRARAGQDARAGRRARAEQDARPARTSPSTAGALVVRRRLAGGGAERLLVVTALATAFGLAAHVLVGGELVRRSVQDKAAVLAGAELVVDLDQAGQVDPALPAEGYPREVAVVPGDTAVFRDSGRLPDDRTVDIVVVDLTTFADVASWGSPGGPLERARAELDVLARADAGARPECPSLPLGANLLPPAPEPDPPPPDCPPRPPAEEGLPLGRVAAGPAPVLVVGDATGLPVGAQARLADPNGDLPLVVVGHVEAFPGVDTDLRTGLVGATASYLPRLAGGDPRVTSLEDGSGAVSRDVDGVELWSTRPVAAVAADLPAVEGTAETLADDRRVRTAGEQLGRPAFVAVDLVAPYLQVLAGIVLVVAVLALCLSVDRAASRARAGDIVLARAGLGRTGTRRLLAAEAAVLVLAGLALGALGWAATVPLLPRLLEPEPSVGPLLVPVAVPWAGAVVAGAALVALLAAVVVVRAGTRSASEEEVLRGQD